jgi:hypothetical protein
MSKAVSKKRSDAVEVDIVKQFIKVDTSDLPDFHSCETTLEMGLWVLAMGKEKLEIKKMTAEQIAIVLRDAMEVGVSKTSIVRAFARAGKQVYADRENGEVLYQIMMTGKKHLLSIAKEGNVEVFYFEPNKKYSSKKLFIEIIAGLDGEMRIVDPYCGERTLDCLRHTKGRKIKVLTRVANLPQKAREQFLRELRDFQSENPDIELRNYPNTDLHDRYIISPSSLVILGHSIKDLGGKESFAIILNKETIGNILEALSGNFDRRWKQSINI